MAGPWPSKPARTGSIPAGRSIRSNRSVLCLYFAENRPSSRSWPKSSPFPRPSAPPLREAIPADLSSDAVDALRDAFARLAHEQPDALAPILAVAFADATADLPKAMADRLARESAATLLPLLPLLPLLHKLCAFFLFDILPGLKAGDSYGAQAWHGAAPASLRLAPASDHPCVATAMPSRSCRRGTTTRSRRRRTCPERSSASSSSEAQQGQQTKNCRDPLRGGAASPQRQQTTYLFRLLSIRAFPRPPTVGSTTCPFSRTPSPSVSLRACLTSSGSGLSSSTPKASG